MRHLEDELAQALRRPQPPAGFADRLRARIAGQTSFAAKPASGRRWSYELRHWHRLAAAAVLLMVAGGGVHHWRERRDESRREADTARLVWALNLTGRKVRHLEQTVSEKRWVGLWVARQKTSSHVE